MPLVRELYAKNTILVFECVCVSNTLSLISVSVHINKYCTMNVFGDFMFLSAFTPSSFGFYCRGNEIHFLRFYAKDDITYIIIIIIIII